MVSPDLECLSIVSPSSAGPLHVFLCHYLAADFELQLFSTSEIECPPHIVRSLRRRQAEFFYGRWCARHALAALGVHKFEVGTGTQRQPLWPAGVMGSISHVHDLAVAVAIPHNSGSAIGIDIERIAEGQSITALTATVISEAERSYLEQSSLPFPCALTIVFSAKESFFKAFYLEVGRYFDFDAVNVTLIDPANQLVELCVKEALSARLLPGVVHRVRYHMLDDQTICTLLHC